MAARMRQTLWYRVIQCLGGYKTRCKGSKLMLYEQGVVYDVIKVYNSIKTTLVERHVCRLWFH